MKRHVSIGKLLPLLILFLFSSCSPDPFPDPSRKVEFQVINQEVEPPAKVTVYFKLDSKNEVPIAGMEGTDFIIYEKGQNDKNYVEISEFEAERKIVDDERFFTFNTVLLLDLSGSVTANYLDELKSSSISFVRKFIPDSPDSPYSMSIWWFDGEDEIHPLVGFTNSQSTLISGINSISTGMSSDNTTDLYGAVMDGLVIAEDKFLEEQDLGNITGGAVVVFTDGTDQAQRHPFSDASSSISSRPEKLKILTIGLGDEIDKKILRQIGEDGFAFAENASKLEETFEEIAEFVSAEARSYYIFRFCSAKRSGSNISLKIEVNTKYRNKKIKGDVITSYDATGFSGGCSL